MNRLIRIIPLVLLTIILAGCGSAPYTGTASGSVAASPGALSQSAQRVRASLQDQYQVWQGTPYLLGGDSRRGIDCSAFTRITYRELGLTLPRTTAAQVQQGVNIDIAEMVPGDLVFFKTGVKVRHVGIYMGLGEFVHASTRRGVTISRLDNPYWQQHFWQARRVY